MRSIFLVLVSSLYVSGCASIIQSSDDIGGVSDERWGIVEYRDHNLYRNQSKKVARNKMSEYCAPQRYKVVDTADRTKASTVYDDSSFGSRTLGSGMNTSSVTPAISGYKIREYVRWKFVCVD